MKQYEAMWSKSKKNLYIPSWVTTSFCRLLFFAAIPVEKPFCMAHHAHELSRLYRWSLSRSHHIASRNNVPLPPSVDATFPLSILWVFFDKFYVSHTYSSVERGIGYFGKNVLTSAERTRLLLSKSFCEGHSSIYYQGRDGGSWISKSNTPTLRLQLLLVLKS